MKYSRLASIIVAILAITAGSGKAQTAAPVMGATSITKVPFVISKPGTYVVRKDLVLPTATGTAIQIVSGTGVTLDLGGHVISSGFETVSGSNQSVGISARSPARDIVVRNGVLKNFSTGVDINNINYSYLTLVEKLSVHNSGIIGIQVAGLSAEVRDCHVIGTGYEATVGLVKNATAGIYAAGYFVKVINNEVSEVVTGSTSMGIHITGLCSAVVDSNVVSCFSSGVYGIYFDSGSDSNFACNNNISNFTNGIAFGYIGGSTHGKYRDNLTYGCTTKYSGGTAVGDNN